MSPSSTGWDVTNVGLPDFRTVALRLLDNDAQVLHVDEKLSTSSTSIWPMMMMHGSTGRSHHWTVVPVGDLGEDMLC